MKEIRILTKPEFERLLKEAEETETRFISKIVDPYEYFRDYAVKQSGLIIDNRVIYWGALVKLRDKFELWTVVNQDVQEQFTLYKEAKKAIYSWLEQCNPIYATMNQGNEVNKKWVEKMNFKKVEEDDRFITYVLTKEKI